MFVHRLVRRVFHRRDKNDKTYADGLDFVVRREREREKSATRIYKDIRKPNK